MVQVEKIERDVLSYNFIHNLLNDAKRYDAIEVTKLRSCNATVENRITHIILRSYGTIVAVIDCDTGVCYDVLRVVYGYTATSAQHIAKFVKDYSIYITKIIRVM